MSVEAEWVVHVNPRDIASPVREIGDVPEMLR